MAKVIVSIVLDSSDTVAEISTMIAQLMERFGGSAAVSESTAKSGAFHGKSR